MSPTYTEYEAAVIAEIVSRTGCTETQARNLSADLYDCIEDGLTPSDAAYELLRG